MNSSVVTWPDAQTVDLAVRQWAAQQSVENPNIERIGYFGSYARGDWGVGSDVDLVIVMRDCSQPFVGRAAGWDTAGLPVPSDVLVYTAQELHQLDPTSRFAKMLSREVVWVYPNE